MSLKPTPRYTRLTSDQRRAGLIAAGLACMARGGIQAFTVDKICHEAGVSRGLITHHFGSMNGLLAAVYGQMYEATTPNPDDLGSPDDPEPSRRISGLIDFFFSPGVFNRQALNIWLTLWGQISNNPELRAEHRRQYAAYHAMVTTALADLARHRGRDLNAGQLAATLICLVDGMGLQHCIDPETMPAATARHSCRDLLALSLGPIPD